MNNEYIEASMGEYLAEEFLKPLKLSQNQLAIAIGVPNGRINEIVNNKRSITADTDLRFCKYFALSEGFFLRIQEHLELVEAKKLIIKELDSIVPFKENNKAMSIN